MRAVTAALVLSAASLAAGGHVAQQAPPLVGRTFDALVVRIADGDTLEVVPAGQRERLRVRLEGVDAPELGEVFSRDAQTFLRRLLFDQRVRVSGRDVDRYGRLVARIEVGGRDASVALLDAGLACQRFATDAVLAAAAAQARAAGRGFWAPAASKPQCVARVASAPRASPSRAPTVTSGPVRGNVSNKLYHLSSCPNFRCRNCTRLFASEAEARSAGFHPAGDCAR
jgi:endonuclease YncB( thermonuclease family)